MLSETNLLNKMLQHLPGPVHLSFSPSHLSWPSPCAGPASIWVIQYFRSCAMSSVSRYFFMSPCMLSLHLFLGRPRLLLPETSSLSDFAQMWLGSRLKQWPNHFSLLLSRKVSTGFTWASFLMSSFLMWSNLVFPLAHLNILISAEFSFSHLSSLRPNILNRTSSLVWSLFWRLCLSILRASSYRTSPRILPSTSSIRFLSYCWNQPVEESEGGKEGGGGREERKRGRVRGREEGRKGEVEREGGRERAGWKERERGMEGGREEGKEGEGEREGGREMDGWREGGRKGGGREGGMEAGMEGERGREGGRERGMEGERERREAVREGGREAGRERWEGRAGGREGGEAGMRDGVSKGGRGREEGGREGGRGGREGGEGGREGGRERGREGGAGGRAGGREGEQH